MAEKGKIVARTIHKLATNLSQRSKYRFLTYPMSGKTDKTVFATVGTTKFDKFVFTLTQQNTLSALKQKGYNSLTIQIGNGSVIPDEETAKQVGLTVSYFRFKNSILEDISKADLVISHAGAGSCLEVLDAKKPLLVVINEDLMNNHQIELADQLSFDGHLISCNCDTLAETIHKMNLTRLKEFLPSEKNVFSNYLDKFMGFQK